VNLTPCGSLITSTCARPAWLAVSGAALAVHKFGHRQRIDIAWQACQGNFG
jgi:hypothetical protein